MVPLIRFSNIYLEESLSNYSPTPRRKMLTGALASSRGESSQRLMGDAEISLRPEEDRVPPPREAAGRWRRE